MYTFKEILRLWLGLEVPVKRRSYALSGIFLMALKYLVDALVYYYATGRFFEPAQYFSPLITSRTQHISNDYVIWGLLLWTLPFMWIGISMSMRRVIDAGYTPWISLLFFVPFANYAFMVFFAFAPSTQRHLEPPEDGLSRSQEITFLAMILRGAIFGVVLTFVMTGISVYLFGNYGTALFFGTPFVIGCVTAMMFNRYSQRTVRETVGVVFWSIVIASLALPIFALEGLICVIMAFPIALAAALMGAALGRFIALGYRSPVSHICLTVFSLPFLSWGELAVSEVPIFETITSIEIDAPPERIWPSVIGFSEIKKPPSLVLKAGIAYPLRARLDGEGVGATRYCEFSTGPFVEPITVWDAPTRLSFDVAAQPPPMSEWSPYRHVHPPHLDGYFRSLKGEFRLIALPNGGTRLEGSTWYRIGIFPSSYWRVWSDLVLHLIHKRVLEHIKAEVEAH